MLTSACSPASCIRRARLSRSVFSRCFRCLPPLPPRSSGSIIHWPGLFLQAFRGFFAADHHCRPLPFPFPGRCDADWAPPSTKLWGNGARRVGQNLGAVDAALSSPAVSSISDTLRRSCASRCRTTLRSGTLPSLSTSVHGQNQPPPSKTRTRIMHEKRRGIHVRLPKYGKTSTLSSGCRSPRYRTPIAFNVLQHVLFHRVAGAWMEL